MSATEPAQPVRAASLPDFKTLLQQAEQVPPDERPAWFSALEAQLGNPAAESPAESPAMTESPSGPAPGSVEAVAAEWRAKQSASTHFGFGRGRTRSDGNDAGKNGQPAATPEPTVDALTAAWDAHVRNVSNLQIAMAKEGDNSRLDPGPNPAATRGAEQLAARLHGQMAQVREGFVSSGLTRYREPEAIPNYRTGGWINGVWHGGPLPTIAPIHGHVPGSQASQLSNTSAPAIGFGRGHKARATVRRDISKNPRYGR